MVTITGERLRDLLDERVAEHYEHSARWRREMARTPEEQTEEAPLLPEHMYEYEADRLEWRAAVLEFLRDHLDPQEVYRLGESDLEFGELLPPKPEQMEQEEYEERTRIGFELGRLAKRVGPIGGPEMVLVTRPEAERARRVVIASSVR
jgi:hypothetical protein